MAVFKDHTGQEWKLRLTVGSVKKVKDETGVNLALASKDKSLSWLNAIFADEDEGKLVQILYSLCEEQCKAAGLSPEDFAHRFDGPTVSDAGDALAEAIADFFPRSRIAQALRGKLKTVLAEAEEKAIQTLERPSSMDSPKPTSAPASAESIPAS